MPQFWSIWECRRCGYRGPVILEDDELAKKLEQNYNEKKVSQQKD
jgi:hypothetical protein